MKTSTSFKPNDPKINRNGRPKREWTVAGLIEEAMEEQDEKGISYKQIVYRRLVELARRGDMLAVKEINNRLDGMPAQKTDITSGGKPLPTPIYGGKSTGEDV